MANGYRFPAEMTRIRRPPSSAQRGSESLHRIQVNATATLCDATWRVILELWSICSHNSKIMSGR